MSISGLCLYEEIFNTQVETSILNEIDSREWSNKLSRRTQHYGYIYDYTSSNVLEKAEEFPQMISSLAKYLNDNKIFTREPNQCIVNEYLRNQGINPHIDRNIFGNTIASITLGSECVMTFTRNDQKIEKLLPRRSMLVLKDEARYEWKHSISPNVKYTYENINYVKPKDYRRVSITFRNY